MNETYVNKCKIYRDLILNDNKFHRDIDWKRLKLSENQPGLCCAEMKRTFGEFSVDYDDNHEIGLYERCYEDSFIVPIRFCPFCGAEIEYVKHKTKKYVSKEITKWTLEDVI